MADVTIFDLSTATAYAEATTSGISAASATQTIPCENGKDFDLILRVLNAGGQDAVVTLKAPTTDGGVRKGLGDLVYTIANGKTRYIRVGDTARFKDLSDNDIDVTITTTGTIGSIQVEAIQL